MEQTITVKLDPRVATSSEDIARQTELSLKCYESYLQLQEIRDEIDQILSGGGRKLRAKKRSQLESLRGKGQPGDSDILYGSIYETNPGEESIVGLQHKYLFLLNLLQSADSRPTTQAKEGIGKLKTVLLALVERWDKLK